MNPQEMSEVLYLILQAPETIACKVIEITPGALSVEFLEYALAYRASLELKLQPERAILLSQVCMYLIQRLDSMGAFWAKPQSDPNSYAALFQQYQEFCARARSGGEINPDRLPAMNRSTDRLQGIIEALSYATRPLAEKSMAEMSMEDLQNRAQQMREQKREIASLMTDALSRTKKLPNKNRAAQVRACLDNLKLFVMREGQVNLAIRMGHLTKAIDDAAGDERKLLLLESEEARNAAYDVRLYAKLGHFSLMRPLWPFRNDASDPNLLFYAGPDSTCSVLEEVAGPLRLQVSAVTGFGAEIPNFRWRALQTAALAIFDLSECKAQVYYELGIAVSLGKELLILTTEDETIPFDVSPAMLVYGGPDDLKEALERELTSSLYGLQCTGEQYTRLPECLAYVEQLVEKSNLHPLLAVALQELRATERDPQAFASAFLTLNTYLEPTLQQLVVFPRGPALYPAGARCFIVMPFREEMDPVYSALAEICSDADIPYVRGDLAEGQEVIQSVWQEICYASHITVDLTNFNPNVCLELGMADTLGRRTFLIGVEGTERHLQTLFPSMAKRRFHPYNLEYPAADPKFSRALERFLKSGNQVQ